MKKLLKILGMILLALLVILIIAFVVINSGGIPTYEAEAPSFKAKVTPEAIARGEKLATMLCAGCHMDPESKKLVGKLMADVPAEFGTIYTPNITADPTYGIGDWTDGEIMYLLRTGIKRDGHYAPPYMAKLPNMADSDINAIISFLRSGHPMVAADPTPDKAPEPSFLVKLLSRIAWKPLPMPEKSIPLPDSSNTLALGEYLAHNLDCFTCHSADFKTLDIMHPENTPGYFGGGNTPLNLEGEVVLTANLTPDKETGIGNWTREYFIQVVKTGIKGGDEPALQYPMMPYTMLTDHEIGSIFDYLQTIPAIDNKVNRSIYNQ